MHPLDDSCFISNPGSLHSNFLTCQLGDNTCLKSCVCRWEHTVVLFITLSGGAYSIYVYCHGGRSLLLRHMYVAVLCLGVFHVLL